MRTQTDVYRETDSLRDAGVSGVLVHPPVDGRNGAAVVVIGGSEGGHHEADAVALAKEGFTALALAYFRAPGVPPVLQNIPLEYFTKAIDVLEDLGFAAGTIGLIGGSRGGEVALLVASRDARIGSVVSVVGGGVLTQGIDFSNGHLLAILANSGPSWTINGEPLPYLPYQITSELRARVEQKELVRLRDAFSPLPGDPDALETISIPVERIRGSILLISSPQDVSWDSTAYSEVAADRLRRADHPYPWEHLKIEGAGHLIAGPPRSPIRSTTGPGPGVTFDFGGTPEGATRGREQAWAASVKWLKEGLTA